MKNVRILGLGGNVQGTDEELSSHQDAIFVLAPDVKPDVNRLLDDDYTIDMTMEMYVRIKTLPQELQLQIRDIVNERARQNKTNK